MEFLSVCPVDSRLGATGSRNLTPIVEILPNTGSLMVSRLQSSYFRENLRAEKPSGIRSAERRGRKDRSQSVSPRRFQAMLFRKNRSVSDPFENSSHTNSDRLPIFGEKLETTIYFVVTYA
jgi:hypothetical protein